MGVWGQRKKGNRHSVNLHSICSSETLISTVVRKRSADLFLPPPQQSMLSLWTTATPSICWEWENSSKLVLPWERSVQLKTTLVLGLSQETCRHKVLDRHASVQSVTQTFSFSFVSIKSCISRTLIKKFTMTRLSLQKNSYATGLKSKL